MTVQIQYYTPDLLYKRLKPIQISGETCFFSYEKCIELTPIINEILELKKSLNAVILAHSYVGPEIQATVADFVGDSYGLSKDARDTQADVIVFCAVKFMAETAKILSPTKQVFIPTTNNGCSLADSITAQDIQMLRQSNPNYTIVCYINTSAEVKAECDVCVTSANVYTIIERIPNPNIYFLPDQLMGENVIIEMKKRGINKNIKLWKGNCYAHKEYQPEMIDFIRIQYPNAAVACHPECMSEVLQKSDFTGSTGQLIDFVKKSDKTEFFLLTECGLADRLRLDAPDKIFVGSCTLCKYMKANTLKKIRDVLKSPTSEQMINVNTEIREKAARSIQAMFDYTKF